MIKQTIKIILGVIILVVAVYYLSLGANFSKIAESFAKVNFFFFSLACLFLVLTTLVKVFRWRFMLADVKEIKFRSLLSVFYIAQFFSNILPFRAGDVFQVVYLGKKEKVSKAIVLSSVIAYQVVDFISLLVIFIVASFFFVVSKNMFELALILFIFSLVVLGLYVFFHRRIAGFLSGKEGWLYKKTHLLNDGLKMFGKLNVLYITIFYSICMWILAFAQSYLILLAFGIKLSVSKIFLYLVVPMLVSILPSTPGSFGIWELGAVGTLSLFGIEKSLAIAISFTNHFAGFIISFMFGLYFVVSNGLMGFVFGKKILNEGNEREGSL
ncbi:MAG: flippase-like domain-containing protein [Endomicrobiales bacterium]|nr:flippase-like domain-containing protein [Endomicrobiales bacterium]